MGTIEHNYLIDVVQSDSPTYSASSKNSLSLMLNHPVKELIWAVLPSSNVKDIPSRLTGARTKGKGQLRSAVGATGVPNPLAGQNWIAPSQMKSFFNFEGVEPINGENHAFESA